MKWRLGIRVVVGFEEWKDNGRVVKVVRGAQAVLKQGLVMCWRGESSMAKRGEAMVRRAAENKAASICCVIAVLISIVDE